MCRPLPPLRRKCSGTQAVAPPRTAFKTAALLVEAHRLHLGKVAYRPVMSELIGLLAGLLSRAVGPLLRRLGLYGSGRVRIRIATPHTGEKDLDWPQVLIQNPGSRWSPRSVQRATIHALIDGKKYVLMWSTPQGPREMIDIPVRGEIVASLAIRNCSETEKWYSIPADARPLPSRLSPWISHVTDVNFHTQQDSSRTLLTGTHFVHVVVTHDGGSATRSLVLDVPPPPRRHLALREP